MQTILGLSYPFINVFQNLFCSLLQLIISPLKRRVSLFYNLVNPNAQVLSSPGLDTVNPFNAETTFVQSTRTQRFLKSIQTLSCWYSLESSR